MKQPISTHAGFSTARPVRRFMENRLAAPGLALFTLLLCAVFGALRVYTEPSQQG